MDRPGDLEPLDPEDGLQTDSRQGLARRGLLVTRPALSAIVGLTVLALTVVGIGILVWHRASSEPWKCSSRATRVTLADLGPSPGSTPPPLGATATVVRVASGTLGPTPWRVVVGSDGTMNIVSLVAGPYVFTNSANSPLDGWFTSRNDKGVWLFGAVPTTVKRISAVLDSGIALTGCPAVVGTPFNKGWFALAIPAGRSFRLAEALARDGRVVVWAENISPINGSSSVATTQSRAG